MIFSYVFSIISTSNQDIVDRLDKNKNEMTDLIRQLIGKCILIKEDQDSLSVSNLQSLDELKKSHIEQLVILKENLIEEIRFKVDNRF